MRIALVLSLALASAGCAGTLLGPSAEAPEVYRLEIADAAKGAERLPLALGVARPRAAPSLDTERIAVVQPDSRFDYFAGIRWSEPAPQMLQALIVRVLQSSSRFEVAVAAPSRVPTRAARPSAPTAAPTVAATAAPATAVPTAPPAGGGPAAPPPATRLR